MDKNVRKFYNIRVWKNGKFLGYVSIKSDKILRITKDMKDRVVCMNSMTAEIKAEMYIEEYSSSGYYFDYISYLA